MSHLKSHRLGSVVPRLLVILIGFGAYMSAEGRSLQMLSAAQEANWKAWRVGAHTNVSRWRSELFLRTMQIYKGNIAEFSQGAPIAVAGSRLTQHAVEPFDLKHEQTIFDLMNPFITCPPPGILTKVGGHVNAHGQEDGHKFICNVAGLQHTCLVMSMGSNADTTFEQGILAKTACDVATFDCTVNLNSLGPRHKFFKKCIGSEAASKANENYITWEQAVRMANHTKVDLLKIDIEGFEYDVLGTWTEFDLLLPRQIAVETHTYFPQSVHVGLLYPQQRLSLSQYALFAMHFANLGYGVVSRDDNQFGTWASEFLLHRVHEHARLTLPVVPAKATSKA